MIVINHVLILKLFFYVLKESLEIYTAKITSSIK